MQAGILYHIPFESAPFAVDSSAIEQTKPNQLGTVQALFSGKEKIMSATAETLAPSSATREFLKALLEGFRPGAGDNPAPRPDPEGRPFTNVPAKP